MITSQQDGRNIYLRASGVWLVLTAGMFFNGAIRELTYQPLVGFETGHAISCITGIAIIFLISHLFVRRHPGVAPSKWIAVGLLWVVLTVAFEFGFGHFIAGNSWDTLLADYNLLRGRLWVLVLLSAFVAPVFWGRRTGAVAVSTPLSHA